VITVDIHVHIHDGSVKEGKAPAKRSRSRSAAAPTSSSKPKRKVSAYQKAVGRHMKALKGRKFRGNVMKQAHKLAKKETKGKK
jgi:hypothetical protein